MFQLIAQTAPPSPTPGAITIDPSALGGLGGIGLFFWAIAQVALKVWEKKATTQIATETVRTEAEILQEGQALTTLVEVYKNTSEASVRLQEGAFKANADLISQLSSIRANAAEVHYEGIKEALDALSILLREQNGLIRSYNVSLVDLTEEVTKINWRLDNATGRTN